MSDFIARLLARLPAAREEAGQGLAEYALILFLIAVAAYVAIQGLGGGISGIFNTISSRI